MKLRYSFLPAALTALAALSSSLPALASGSISFGSGASGSAKTYNLGKQVASQKLLCGACPLKDQTMDKALAGRVLAEAPLTAALSADERSALTAYLRRRFDI